ncbi:MAG TPA: hypothetical protein VN762_09475 [Steroidobacteraceae bacterium]|nr:hypothetical protein [Steroidobacteraceae bacterium]
MEAHALAASLQRSREQLRAELFSTEDPQGLMEGLMPRSAVMSFLLAPERRGLVLTVLGAAFAMAGRGGGLALGQVGLGRLLWSVLGMALRRRR